MKVGNHNNQPNFSHNCKAVGSGKISYKNCGSNLFRFRISPASIQLIALNRQKVGGVYKTKSKEGEQYLIIIKLN